MKIKENKLLIFTILVTVILSGCANTGYVYNYESGRPIEGAWVVSNYSASSFRWVMHGWKSNCFEGYLTKTDESGKYSFPGFPIVQRFTKTNEETVIKVYSPGLRKVYFSDLNSKEKESGHIYMGPYGKKIEEILRHLSGMSGYCGDRDNSDYVKYQKLLYDAAKKVVMEFNEALDINLKTGEVGDLKYNYKELFETNPRKAEIAINTARNTPSSICFDIFLTSYRNRGPDAVCPWPESLER